MDTTGKARTLKEEIILAIQNAADNQDTEKIFALSSLLKKSEDILVGMERLTEDLKFLGQQVESIKSGNTTIRGFREPRPRHNDDTKTKSARAHGEEMRSSLLKELEDAGVRLNNKKGSLYTAGNGGLIGIACATERQPQKWFLGLPKRENYTAIILLCEGEFGKLHPLVIGRKSLEDLYGKLSYSADQFKFNVNSGGIRGTNFSLSLPGAERVDISNSVRNWSVLK